MNKEAILTFIKKNVLGLVCGLLALVSIGLIFYPIGGMISSLQSEADQSGQVYTSLESYLTKSRKYPLTDPHSEPGPLPQGPPTPNIIKVGKESVEHFKSASELMLKNAVSLSEQDHTPLVPDVLPKNSSDTSPITFGKVYQKVLSTDLTIHGVPDPLATPPVSADPLLAQYGAKNLQNDILHGGLPPTPAEIDARAAALWNDVYAPQIVQMNGKPTNLDKLKAECSAESSLIPQQMKSDAARKRKIYVESTAFTTNSNISSSSGSLLSDIWYAQMQLWVQQDVANGIAEANKDATNILDGVVKRLITIQVPADKMYVLAPANPQATGALPGTLDETSKLEPNYNLSVTGRYSNAMYDVMRFYLVVDVDSGRVNKFIRDLEHNRFIAITNQSQWALNADTESSRGYYYGAGSAVRLQLECEELFMRKWTNKLMPDTVKSILEPKPGAAPGGSLGGPGGGMGGMGGPGGPGMMMPPGAPPGGPGFPPRQ